MNGILPYFNKKLVWTVIYMLFLLFMIGINIALFFNPVYKSFVIQQYPMFNFKVLGFAELAGMLIASVLNYKYYSNWLSGSSALLFLLTGIAVPYLIVSFLRVIIIGFEGYYAFYYLVQVLKAFYSDAKVESKENKAEKEEDD